MKYIGIDPGKETGFAVWDHDAKYLAEVDTMSITQAMEKVRTMPTYSAVKTSGCISRTPDSASGTAGPDARG